MGTQEGPSSASLPKLDTHTPSLAEPPRQSVTSHPRVSTQVNVRPASPSQSTAPRLTIGTASPPMTLPSGKVLGSIGAGIVVLLCVAGWYMWGVELDLITDPGGAEVVLDGKPVGSTVGQGGSLVVPHVTHGTHALILSHPGFDVWSQTVPLGWFQMSHPLTVKLPVPSFPLAVLTNPGGARVQLDGNEAGASDESGNLVVQGVPRGQHVVTVTLAGYPPWSNSFWIESPLTLRADLAAAAAAAQQEIASRFSRAQMLFEQRQYQEAIAECDAILRLDAANQQATNLKTQIQQTMSILGVR